MKQIDLNNYSYGEGFIYLISSILLILILRYFYKKMENMATRDDIGGITKEIEVVKQEYREKNSQLSAQLNLLNQYRFSFAEEKRKTLLRYFDILSESIHTVNSMSLHKFNESVGKLNKNDELRSPILKRIAMLMRNKLFGKLDLKITEAINSFLDEGTGIIEDHGKRTDPLLLMAKHKIYETQDLQKIRDKDFEECDDLFRGIKLKRYEEIIHPIEQEIHDLIYKELNEIMSLNEQKVN